MHEKKAIRHALISSGKRMSFKQFRIVRFEFEINKIANSLMSITGSSLFLSHNVVYIITEKTIL